MTDINKFDDSKTMAKIVNDVTELKKEFEKIYQTKYNVAIEIIKKMRILHGKCIYHKESYVKYIQNNSEKANDECWYKLSNMASFMYVIHCHIRHCEKLLFGGVSSAEHSTEFLPEIKTNTENEPFESDEHTKSDNITEISINVPSSIKVKPNKFKVTEEFSLSKSPIIISPQILEGGELFDSDDNMSTSEYINNLNTTEADRLYSEYQRGMSGGTCKVKIDFNYNDTEKSHTAPNIINESGVKMSPEKTTVINFWADWCHYSKLFKPTWDKFTEYAAKNLKIQVADVNVGSDEKLKQLAAKNGVMGYPTIVMYHNGKRTTKAGNMPLNEIIQFVAECTGQK